jgi:hypothetical protein
VEKIIIDDGTRKYTFENEQGEVDLIKRYREKLSEFENIQDMFSKISWNADGTVDEASEIDDIDRAIGIMNQVQNLLKETMNYIFDADVYDSLFAKRNPFSSVGEKPFVEVAMKAIGEIIGDSQKDQKAKTKNNVLNQTKGYTK